jgi:hypothetical protein
MKDISGVLLQKEQDLLRVRQEIEALRVVITLLADEKPARIAAGDLTPLPVGGNRWPLEVQGLTSGYPQTP